MTFQKGILSNFDAKLSGKMGYGFVTKAFFAIRLNFMREKNTFIVPIGEMDL